MHQFSKSAPGGTAPKINCIIVTKSFNHETIANASKNEKYTIVLILQYFSDS